MVNWGAGGRGRGGVGGTGVRNEEGRGFGRCEFDLQKSPFFWLEVRDQEGIKTSVKDLLTCNHKTKRQIL
jgi:hypothetical protein